MVRKIRSLMLYLKITYFIPPKLEEHIVL